MPELPEVETVKRGLSRLLPGLTIVSAASDTLKSFPNNPQDVAAFLVGAQVRRVERRAKVLIIELSTKYSLIVHLKMTGQLVFRGSNAAFGAGHPSNSLVGTLPDTSTRVTLRFADGSYLFFNDQRKFGWMRLLPTAEVAEIDFFKRVGPEPLDSTFTWQVLWGCLQRRKNTGIKAALLDQTVIAGVGNIYADESLWGSRIHPQTLVRDLPQVAVQALHQALISILQLSIEKGGSTSKTYVDAEGRQGSYLSFARVFRRQGQPCPRCGTTIIKLRVAGRGTHICPHCQQARYSGVGATI